jgi:micrococcal nuclease
MGDDSAEVVSITDGDTIKVSIGGVVEPLRLIGINAPEGGECMAAEATARLTALVGGKSVRLESDVSDRDIYDRLLRYVYIDSVFVNETLVREGLAIARRYEPDTAKAVVLEAAQTQSEADQVGMWAPDACGVASTADIRVGTIRYDADGNDNENLNDEWIEIVNAGTGTVDMTGWGVKDESASHRYNFPNGFTLAGGGTVRLHTGCGTDTASYLHWCNTGSAVWNNSGDTVFILDPSGNIVDSLSY